MTETAQPGGDIPVPATMHADGLPIGGQPIIAARALAAPATVNRAARTVEVVWSTGARARNFVPPLGLITEELDMSPSAVRMDGLRGGGAPVLNTHRSNDARDVVGRVLDARIEAGRGIATLQFSSATDVEPLWQRVADGTLRSVSVGYRVHRYMPIQDPVVGTVHRAVDWEPYEISVVPIPVDPAAAVRGDGDRLPTGAAAIEPAIPSPTPAPASQETPMPDPTTETTTAAPTDANRGAPSIADAVAEALRADRERNAALNTVLTASRGLISAPVGDALHQRALTEGWTPDAFRSALWDAMLQGAKPPAIPASPASPAASNDDPAVIREAMAEALAVRTMPGYQAPAGSTRHAEFLGWRPSEMVAELMRARGERNIPRDTAKLAERAFHTTSDFPLLLSAAANKMLLAAYQPANPTYRQIFLRRDFRDFKPHRHLRVGDFPNLVALSENGEIQAGTMSESQEIVLLQTFARRIRVTRPMLVNDDLGAFTDFAAAIGRR
ncbi:MAG: terminase, partial [Alphaproteobacteria bacterium]|nr:terminase [Alphaproteobacteria bacterium]